MTEPARWTEVESEAYRDLAAYAVPERERQAAIAIALVAASPADGRIVELCCGEGVLTQSLLSALPGVEMLAFDGSPSMLAATSARCGGSAGRLTVQAFDLAACDWHDAMAGARAVVSSLAVHHLDSAGKRRLFRAVRARLAPGGVFVLADVIRPETSAGQGIAGQMWDEETRRRSQASHGDDRGFLAFQTAEWNHFHTGLAPDGIDKPASVVEHLDWLRNAGFAGADIHWMLAGQALFSAWKA